MDIGYAAMAKVKIMAEVTMNKKWIVTYTRIRPSHTYTAEIEAPSKYAAKKRFYQLHPRYDIVKVEEKK